MTAISFASKSAKPCSNYQILLTREPKDIWGQPCTSCSTSSVHRCRHVRTRFSSSSDAARGAGRPDVPAGEPRGPSGARGLCCGEELARKERASPAPASGPSSILPSSVLRSKAHTPTGLSALLACLQVHPRETAPEPEQDSPSGRAQEENKLSEMLFSFNRAN